MRRRRSSAADQRASTKSFEGTELTLRSLFVFARFLPGMKHVVLLLIFVAGAAHARSLAHAYPFVLPRQTVPEGGVLYVFFPTESCSDDPAELAAGQRKMLENSGSKRLSSRRCRST